MKKHARYKRMGDLTPRLKAWPGAATTILGTVRFAAFNTSEITDIIAMD